MKNIIFHFLTMFCLFTMEYGVTTVTPVYVSSVLSGSGHLSGYFVGIFSVAALISKIISVRLSETFGRKALFISGLGICAAVILFYPLASLFILILLVRFAQGFGSGFVRAMYSPITIGIAPINMLAKTIGIIGCASLIAMMWASPFAIWVYDTKGFAPAIFISSVVGFAGCFCAIMVKYKEPKNTIKITGIKSFIEPSVVPLSLLKGWTGAGYGIFLAFGIIFAKSYGGFNAGLVITSYALANLFMRLFAGAIIDRFGIAGYVSSAYAFMFAGYLFFAGGYGPFGFLISAAIIGLGVGMEYTALLYMMGRSVKPERMNAAGATVEIFFSMGLAVGAIGAASLKSFISLQGAFVVAGIWQVAPFLFFILYVLPKYKKTEAAS